MGILLGVEGRIGTHTSLFPTSDGWIQQSPGNTHWNSNNIVVGMSSRIATGSGDPTQASSYHDVLYLGDTVSYTVDVSNVRCGCNAAVYAVPLSRSHKENCPYVYCDANKLCGVSCAEIDIQEANMHAFHSTVHGSDDPSGEAVGIGGGGVGWNGPRHWSRKQYGPGAECINTKHPFHVTSKLLSDERGAFLLKTSLEQNGCELHVSTPTAYHRSSELTRVAKGGMSLLVSYWKSGDMLWLDGPGQDGQGTSCPADYGTRPLECSDSFTIDNLRVA